jgi:hypothetical protein
VNGMVYIASGNSLVNVSNNAISNSLTSGILIEGSGTSPTISNNTFSLVGSAGIRINGFLPACRVFRGILFALALFL